MPDLLTRGRRLAQARRLWAVVLEEDVPQSVAGAAVGVSGATWSRWESDQDSPRRESLERVAARSGELGLPQITAGWLDYGEGEGPGGWPGVVAIESLALRLLVPVELRAVEPRPRVRLRRQ